MFNQYLLVLDFQVWGFCCPTFTIFTLELVSTLFIRLHPEDITLVLMSLNQQHPELYLSLVVFREPVMCKSDTSLSIHISGTNLLLRRKQLQPWRGRMEKCLQANILNLNPCRSIAPEMGGVFCPELMGYLFYILVIARQILDHWQLTRVLVFQKPAFTQSFWWKVGQYCKIDLLLFNMRLHNETPVCYTHENKT